MKASMRVLVTGGAGFIGAHCCKALAQAGHVPVTYDNLSRGHADAVRWGPLIRGDMRDSHLLTETLHSHEIEAVVHFAALAYVGESVLDPLLYYDENLGGMAALLKAMSRVGVARLVFSSSCATYGVPEKMPITEDCPQRPINPYGRTKQVCEAMIADAAAAHGIGFVVLRYFNAAGADPEGEIGERHDPETHLIPRALQAATPRGEPLRVYGTDYPTPDGTCMRDFIHVCDLARAHLLSIEYLDSGGGNAAVNLGTGSSHSVREVIAAVAHATGRHPRVLDAPRRPGDPPELCADAHLARRLLGFTPEYLRLDEMVAHAAPWFGHRVREQA